MKTCQGTTSPRSQLGASLSSALMSDLEGLVRSMVSNALLMLLLLCPPQSTLLLSLRMLIWCEALDSILFMGTLLSAKRTFCQTYILVIVPTDRRGRILFKVTNLGVEGNNSPERYEACSPLCHWDIQRSAQFLAHGGHLVNRYWIECVASYPRLQKTKKETKGLDN